MRKIGLRRWSNGTDATQQPNTVQTKYIVVKFMIYMCLFKLNSRNGILLHLQRIDV